MAPRPDNEAGAGKLGNGRITALLISHDVGLHKAVAAAVRAGFGEGSTLIAAEWDGRRPSLPGRASLVFYDAEEGAAAVRDVVTAAHPAPVVVVLSSGTRGLHAQALTDGAADTLLLDELHPALLRHVMRRAAVSSEAGQTPALLPGDAAAGSAEFRSSPVPTYSWERVGEHLRLVGYNDAAHDITAGKICEYLGVTDGDMYEGCPAIRASLWRCLRERITFREEINYRFMTTGETRRLIVTYAYIGMDRLLVHTEDVTELRKTRDALDQAHELYRTLLLAAPDAVVRAGLDGCITFASPQFAALCGWPSPDDLVGMQGLRFIAPGERDRMRGLVDALTGADPMRNMETLMLRRDGSVFTAEVSASLVRGADGRPYAITLYARDVSARRYAEEQVRVQRDLAMELASAASLDAALAASLASAMRLTGMDAGSVYLLDADTGHLKLKHAEGLPAAFVARVEDLGPDSGRVRAVLRGRPIYANRHEELQLDSDDPAVKEGILASGMTPILHRGRVLGCLSVASHVSTAFPLEARRIFEAIAAQTGNVAARLQAEQALRESEAKYRAVVENVQEGVCILQEGRFAYVNPQLASMLGYPPEALTGRPLAPFLKSGAVEDLLVTDPTRGDGAAHEAVTPCTLIDRRGETVEVEHRAGAIVFGGAPAVLVSMQDVTERNQARRQMADQEVAMVTASRLSALGMMASAVAHQINNPLMIVSGAAQQLREALGQEGINTEQCRRQVDRIVRHTERIARTMQSLNAMARGRGAEAFVRAKLRRIINDTLDLCEARFTMHGVHLAVPDIPATAVLECRPEQVAQVLVNLLNNALDATDAAPEKWVRIECEHAGGWIRVAVSDSGASPPPDVIERLFEPFFTTKANGRGSGLGLTISKGIVDGHHGRLYLDDSCPNTRFVLELPVKQVQE